jgi:ankyrin repeat protein
MAVGCGTVALLFFCLLLLTGCNQRDIADAPAAGANTLGETAVQPAVPAPPGKVAPLPVEETREPVASDAFFAAALAGDYETVVRALQTGTSADAVDDNRRTALMLAAFNGHAAVVETLLEWGTPPNLRDEVGRTALMFAATGNNADAVGLLLDAGAEVNLADRGEHWTALMFAAAEGQDAVVELLLAHGARADVRDIDGDTAADFAAQRGHLKLAERLRGVQREATE